MICNVCLSENTFSLSISRKRKVKLFLKSVCICRYIPRIFPHCFQRISSLRDIILRVFIKRHISLSVLPHLELVCRLRKFLPQTRRRLRVPWRIGVLSCCYMNSSSTRKTWEHGCSLLFVNVCIFSFWRFIVRGNRGHCPLPSMSSGISAVWQSTPSNL